LGVCFTTCFSLGHLGQAATRGNSINFWNRAYDIVWKLPRPVSRCGVIHLKKPSSVGSSTYYRVRPWLLREALTWLIANNPIYKHVLLDEELLETLPAEVDVPSVEIAAENGGADVEEPVETNESTVFSESFVLEHVNDVQTEDDSIMEMLEGRTAEEAFVVPANERVLYNFIDADLFSNPLPNGPRWIPSNSRRRAETPQLQTGRILFSPHVMARPSLHCAPIVQVFLFNVIQRRQIDGLLLQVRSIEPSAPSGSTLDAEVGDGEGPRNQTSKHDVRKYLKDLKPYFRSVRGPDYTGQIYGTI
jgi:hypothetical protein